MDSKKLIKIIRVVVTAEIKKQLPALLTKELKKVIPKEKSQKMVTQEQVEVDPFKLAEIALEQDRSLIKPQKQFSNNPVLNQLLNETAPFEPSGEPRVEQNIEQEVGFTSNIAQGGIDGMRAQMASKMGHGNVNTGTGASPNGLGVQTGVAALDKAMNRDYSDLVKAFDKKKK